MHCFGWTEYNRHPDLSPFIPSLYIDSTKFAFYIYNPPKDYLLKADNSGRFIDEDRVTNPFDKYPGIFFLWAILNHRLFFRRSKIPDLPLRWVLILNVVFIKILGWNHKQLKEFQYCVEKNTEGIDHIPQHCVELFQTVSSEKSRKRKHSENN